MSIYSEPPPLREFRDEKPTLLVCWWATSFCAAMIVSRLIGRFLRTEKLFREDKVAALALIPLFLRMGFLDFVLKEGTNNADFHDITLSEDVLHRKAIASGLVLITRILYAATLWILKATILEFLKRLTDLTWERSYHTTSIAIRWTLLATFLAVIASDLAECRPFNHYWQVLPDPGGQCRQGYVQLITMATCNVLTDLMLVIFPVTLVVRSKMTPCRKLQLVLLFSLSLSVVCVTLFRVVRVIDRQGSQQYRSLMASVELIFATASANALIIGSFIRDRGVKKRKFHRRSTPITFDPPLSAKRRPTMQRHWGSDEDLVRDMGMGVDPRLRIGPDGLTPGLWRKAPIFGPPSSTDDDRCNLEHVQREERLVSKTPSHPSKDMSFLDLGGLLNESVGTSSGSYRRGSDIDPSSSLDPLSPAVPLASRSASISGQRRGSLALLRDVGGSTSTSSHRSSPPTSRIETGLNTIPQSRQPSTGEDLVLADVGGLLKP